MQTAIKHIQYEVFPQIIMYIICIYSFFCTLPILILCIIGMGGQFIAFLGAMQREEEVDKQKTKYIKLGGRSIAHGSTVIMLTLLLSGVFDVRTPA